MTSTIFQQLVFHIIVEIPPDSPVVTDIDTSCVLGQPDSTEDGDADLQWSAAGSDHESSLMSSLSGVFVLHPCM